MRRIFLVPRGRRKLAPRRRRSRPADPAPGFRSWKRGGGQWRAGEFLAGFEFRSVEGRAPKRRAGSAGAFGRGWRTRVLGGCHRGCGSRAAGRFDIEVSRFYRGSSKKDGPLGEESKSPGARAGSSGSLVEHGGGYSTWGRGNWPHSGRKDVLSEAVQLANITWDTFFAFRVLVPLFLRRPPHSDRWISREGFGVYYGFSKLREMTV